jgi:hypothetical protein
MQRLIRSFNTLTDDLRDMLQEQYPDGIDNSHIRTLNTPKGESLRVIELRTSDAIYLIKINAESREEIEQFLDQEEGGGALADDIGGGDGDDIETPDGADGAEDEDDDVDKDLEGDDDDDDADAEEVGGKDEDEDED